MLRQTSLMAIRDIREDGTASTQRLKVLKFVRKFPSGLTRNEISRLLGIKINAVTGRCNELMKDKYGCQLYEDGKKTDRFSKKTNYVLKAAKAK